MADSLPVFDYAQVLPLGLRFPARMTVLPLARGQLALVSPVPIDEASAAAIDALGQVEFLIAPNLLHHLYLGDAARRYPEARVLAPSALRKKRPELRIVQALDAGVPSIMWGVLLGAGAITIAFTFLFGTPNIRAQGLMTAALALTIGIVLLSILALERPFAGITRIQPEAFEQVEEILDRAPQP